MNEFRLIDAFVGLFERVEAPFGPGDDCAVLPRGRWCVTTDSLVEGVHFTRPAFSFVDIGHKALAVNLSDLAAMGAKPSWALCALMLPKNVRDAQVLELGRGMAALAKVHGVKLVGGNVTRARELAVTLTVGGESRRPMLRSGARPGDGVYVTGPLGDAAAGLSMASLSKAQRRPSPHVAVGQAIASFATSCIDVSDGLLQDLGHVAERSGVRIDVTSEAVPVSASLMRWKPKAALQLALTGGEDYVLAFTARRDVKLAFPVWRIGEVTRGQGVWVDGTVSAARGFQHR